MTVQAIYQTRMHQSEMGILKQLYFGGIWMTCPLRVDAVEKVADDLRERFHLAF
jgi:hypothetical protein